MNRQQRRAKVKSGKVTHRDLHEMSSMAAERGTRFAINMSALAFATVLHDKMGFGQKRIMKVLNEVDELCDSICQDYASFEDFANVLKAECGIIIEPYGNEFLAVPEHKRSFKVESTETIHEEK